MLRIRTTTNSITVGTNPFLTAKYVDKFRAKYDASSNTDTIKFRTHPDYEMDPASLTARQATQPRDYIIQWPQQRGP